MTKDQIIAMAREAGFGNSYPHQAANLFDRFAFLVAAQAAAEEREEIAKLCEDNNVELPMSGGQRLAPFDKEYMGMHNGMAYAAAIRERK